MISVKHRPPPEPVVITLHPDGDVTVTVPPSYEYWRLEAAIKRLGEAGEKLAQAASAAHKRASTELLARQIELGLLPPAKAR